jgi:hypothetical protein
MTDIDEAIHYFEIYKNEAAEESANWEDSSSSNADSFKCFYEKRASEYSKMINWLKELQSHRYAWAKLREDIKDEAEFAYTDFDEYKYEVLGIDDVDDLPNDDYRYGMERALELVDIYRPK